MKASVVHLSVENRNRVVDFTYDASQYQHVDAQGKAHPLSTLNREDLMQLACRGIDAMEKMDMIVDHQRMMLDAWRKDEEFPIVDVA